MALSPLRVFMRCSHTTIAVLLTRLGLLIIACTAMGLQAQVSMSYPDNGLARVDLSGLPPGTSSSGTAEQIDLASGSLYMFIPAVTLRQRGGWNLPLGFVYSSTKWAPILNISVSTGSVLVQGYEEDNEDYDIIDYRPIAGPKDNYAHETLNANIPHISASVEYNGDVVAPCGDFNGCYSLDPEWCTTNWTFTDFSGATHTFTDNNTMKVDCHFSTVATFGNILGGDVPNTSDSGKVNNFDDGSFFTLDISNHDDVTVTGPDGLIYHFGAYPYLNTVTNSSPASQVESFVSNPVTKIDFPNSDSIIFTKSDTGFDIKDTVGHHITLSSDLQTIGYIDSNGQPQTVSVEQADVTALPNVTNNAPVGFPTFASAFQYPVNISTGDPTCCVPPPPQITVEAALTAGITQGMYGLSIRYSSTNRRYMLAFDQNDRLLYVGYPSGGYTRYDWRDISNTRQDSLLNVPWDNSQVSHQYVCSRSDGLCSPSDEVVTSYTPSATFPPGYGCAPGNCSAVDLGLNQEMLVQDQEKSVLHGFADLRFPGRTPREVLTKVSDSSGVAMRTTNYSFAYGNDYQWWPTSETTTVNDANGAANQTYKTTYQWDLLSPGAWLHQPTETDYYDFGASVATKTVSQQWNHIGHIYNRLGSTTITDPATGTWSQTAYTYDSNGNEETVTQSGSNATTQSKDFRPLDQWGQPTQATDGRDIVTQFHYSDMWADSSCPISENSSDYLTSVINAYGQITSYKYYTCTGLLASITDSNNQTTSYIYDVLGRVVHISYPDTGTASYSYTDSIPNSIETTIAQSARISQVTNKILDGLGRENQEQLLSDPSGTVYTDTTYDPLGRIATVSNPYRTSSDSTYGIVQHFYDALDRPTEAIEQDGTRQWWCYGDSQDVLHPQPNCHPQAGSVSSALWVDHVDENQSDWQNTSDALGNLRVVMEPGGLETDLSYDGLQNLTSVSQLGVSGETTRHRTFSYTGLKQLIAAFNSESGSTCYGSWNSNGVCLPNYDADGNLRQKTDARGVTISYDYDNLNRLLRKSYLSDATGTPFSCYQYDSSSIANGIGRTASEWTEPAAATSCDVSVLQNGTYLSAKIINAYDTRGRVTAEQQCTKGFCTSAQPLSPPPANCTTLTSPFGLSYCYDLAGNITSYSSGIPTGANAAIFSQTFDAAGHLNAVTSSLTGSLFVGQTFAAHGSWQSAVYGAVNGNGVSLSRTYDSRLRITGESDTGQIVTTPIAGSAVISITGQEQSH